MIIFTIDTSVNCTFDAAFECGYQINGNHPNFKWKQGQGATPSGGTGPLYDANRLSTTGKLYTYVIPALKVCIESGRQLRILYITVYHCMSLLQEPIYTIYNIS